MYDKYLFFYGGIFSQWFRCKFEVDNLIYNCAEQYMMEQKALFFNDGQIREEIMLAIRPKDQKALGRKVGNFDKNKWDLVARNIVYKGNYFKFKQNIGMLDILLQTKGTLLVEASPSDTIYGIGLSESDPKRLDKKNWLGTNWLGEVLTKVREDFIANKYSEEFNWS